MLAEPARNARAGEPAQGRRERDLRRHRGPRRQGAALPARRRRRQGLPADEFEQLSRHVVPRRYRRGGRGGRPRLRHRARRRPLHQRHLVAPCAAGAAPRRVPWPRCRHAVQLGLRDRDGNPAAAHIRQDRRHQRRAQPQLHHQRDRPGAAGREAHLPSPRHGRPRAPPRTGCRGERPRHRRDRRHLQHARRSRSARSHHGIGTQVRFGVSGKRRRGRRRFPRRRRVRAQRPRHRGIHGIAARRSPGRHARKGVRRQRRIRGRRSHHHPVSARDLAVLHLFQSDHAGGGGRRLRGRRRARRSCRYRAGGKSARDGGALPGRPGEPRLRDAAGRAPDRSPDGARYGADLRTGRAPAQARHSRHRAQLSRWCPRATRRSASRSAPTTRCGTSTMRSPSFGRYRLEAENILAASKLAEAKYACR